jgi:hypothetical protein
MHETPLGCVVDPELWTWSDPVRKKLYRVDNTAELLVAN